MKKFLLPTFFCVAMMLMFSLLATTTGEARSYRDSRAVQVREGDYMILPEKSSNYALDVAGGGDASKETWIQLYERNNSDAQIFTIERVDGEWYRIVHKRTGYVVNVAGGHDKNSAQIQIYKDDGTDSCYWRFIDADNGSYIIQSKLDGGRVLDLSDNETSNGRKIQLWDYHTGQAARWVLSSRSGRNNSDYGGSHHSRHNHDDDDDSYHRHGNDDDDDDNSYHRHGGYGGSHHGRDHSRW